MKAAMKILVDVDDLEKSGVLTPALAATLRRSAASDTGSTAINILLAFGAIAMAAGLFALFVSSQLGAVLGAGFLAAGALIAKTYAQTWGKLGAIWMVIGALMLAVSLGALIDNPLFGSLAAAAILLGVGIFAPSHLLVALTPIALGAAIGGSTGYWHACYEISIQEPTLTIALFTLLGAGAFAASKSLTGAMAGLAITFARVCVILVNFGFWIGSLWGDAPGRTWRSENFDYSAATAIPPTAFVVAWLAALALAGFWAARQGRRFLVNTVATFGAIHFYTQWFERLGANPLAVIVAGAATIAFGLALWRCNQAALRPVA